MWRTFLTAIVLTLSLGSMAVHAQHFITKDQEAAIKSTLKSTSFLTGDCTTAKHCRPYIDFAGDCGVATSVEETNMDGVRKGQMRSFLIDDLDSLGRRTTEYPVILDALGKQDLAMNRRLDKLMQIYQSAITIANKNTSPLRRLQEAKPLLESADKTSEEIAKAAGFEYDGGCGAGPEDSQNVDFTLPEKPKSAFYILQMDLDACARILTDPNDPSKCDGWAPLQEKGNELSGNYRYRVTWKDGTVSDAAFKALSKGTKTIPIEK